MNVSVHASNVHVMVLCLVFKIYEYLIMSLINLDYLVSNGAKVHESNMIATIHQLLMRPCTSTVKINVLMCLTGCFMLQFDCGPAC
jgi:hypothetical protein